MANRLLGKSAVVTGAASGMGKAIALAYLREGANVAATDMNEARLKELEQEVTELGLSDHFCCCAGNITVDEDCAAVVKLCADRFGTCNVLSHNAGVVDDFTMVDSVDNGKWDKVIAINLTGAMKVARAALQYFLANEIKANIVMITSNAAFESVTGGPAYCASKAGANALMKSIAFEYGRKGIRCNSICPGPVGTNTSESAPDRNPAGVEVHIKTGYNAHCREWTCMPLGKADDIAPLAVYLASDESRFMNSASIVIDAGVCLSH